MTAPFDQQVTFLYAEAPEACWRFYEEVLGLPLVRDQGRCRIYATASGGQGYLGVCRAGGPRMAEDPRREGGVVLSLVHPDVEGWHARLLTAGVAIEAPPRHAAAYGITSFFFRDPAGYTLEIQRFDRPMTGL